MRSRYLVMIFICVSIILKAGEIKINKIEPPNWWSGMKKSQLQLMVYGEGLEDLKVGVSEASIEIIKLHQMENTDYCFLDIVLGEHVKPGKYTFTFSNKINEIKYDYEIKERVYAKSLHQGFDTEDVIYLITPDRFADGNPENNTVEGFGDEYDRKQPYGRHGGDIQGIINKLDYLKELGITAIWINPLVENNTRISYHGYAATDFYKIDPRFGTNELYKKLVEEAHSRELKIILDHVSNHISIDHPWMTNLPSVDWINGTIDNHLNAKHHKMAYFDPYAAQNTIDKLSKGWFTDHMPDLNQRNELVSNYIIQNTIWWLEYTGLDGIREDTYPYADQEFLAKWAEEIINEYPGLNIVGEVWTGKTAFLAPYQGDSRLLNKFNSNLPAITDFGMRDALYGYLKGDNNLYSIYEVLAKDYLYSDANNLVTFIDNHDIERVMYAAGENIDKAKVALSILLTMRGIPQILYATEIGMVGKPEHGLLRSDFPGGFPGDKRNAFSENGRTEEENDIYSHLKNLLKIRKNYSCLSNGKLTHFPPENDVYVYQRIDDADSILVIVNGGSKINSINLKKLGLVINSFSSTELLSSNRITLDSNIVLEPFEVKIIKLDP